MHVHHVVCFVAIASPTSPTLTRLSSGLYSRDQVLACLLLSTLSSLPLYRASLWKLLILLRKLQVFREAEGEGQLILQASGIYGTLMHSQETLNSRCWGSLYSPVKGGFKPLCFPTAGRLGRSTPRCNAEVCMDSRRHRISGL